jgi:sulfite reductase beta subunit-like hemoprotein
MKKSLDIEELKAGGVIAQRQKDYFSIRIRIPQGNISTIAKDCRVV